MAKTGNRRFWVAAGATVVIGLLATSALAFATADVVPEPSVETVDAQPVQASASSAEPALGLAPVMPGLPFGDGPIFDRRIVVAYYGTANTGALGVLGEANPDKITERLRKAAKPFRSPRADVQIAYELIVSIADGYPGKDGDYSHDIKRADVRRYIDAAHRNKALLVLDLQTGRSGFLEIAKRWAWALKDPYVGLALDPEWRMGPHQIPARVIGSVSAREVNRVSQWLGDLTRRNNLPEKVFMLHSFRSSMLPHIGRIKARPGLAMVEHVDGFGTQGQKLDTYHAVAYPRSQGGTFHMGFKLFYDEDIRRMPAKRVGEIRPRVEFVSFQ
ncbi:MAG: hypothetical protein QM655_11215 [Nocardioidaceae bacterium]